MERTATSLESLEGRVTEPEARLLEASPPAVRLSKTMTGRRLKALLDEAAGLLTDDDIAAMRTDESERVKRR